MILTWVFIYTHYYFMQHLWPKCTVLLKSFLPFQCACSVVTDNLCAWLSRNEMHHGQLKGGIPCVSEAILLHLRLHLAFQTRKFQITYGITHKSAAVSILDIFQVYSNISENISVNYWQLPLNHICAMSHFKWRALSP